MSSSESDANDAVERAAEDASQPAGFAPTESCAELLEEVLRQTRAAMSDGEALEVAEMQVLLRVRRLYAGQPLVLEPVATELVRALLQTRFPGLSASGEFWRKMSRWVAETLLEDPESRARLLALWAQLSEVPP